MNAKNYLTCLGVFAGASTSLSKDDIIFILGLVVTIINLVIAYLDRKKGE